MGIFKAMELVASGKTFADQCEILNCLLRYPKVLKKPVMIHNEFGDFYFPIDYNVWQSSTRSRLKLFKEFNIKRGTFIDVGAMIGKYSLMVSRNPKINVIAIEPAKDNFEVLKGNIQLSQRENITPMNIALSDNDEIQTFYINEKHGSNSLLLKTDRQTKIQCLKLDTLKDQINLRNIKLIKIDVEGAEVNVVKGCLEIIKEFSPKFIIEISCQKNLKEITHLLKGYSVYNVDHDDYCFVKEGKYQ